MRVAILGNAGSGKTTLARWLATRASIPMLDMDTVAWEPGKVAVARTPEAAQSDVRAFCQGNERWVVEGCYASLVEVACESAPLLIFLNPGEAQCLANCRARPWEPHKYVSRAEQDSRLSVLLSWVSEYYTRAGEMSLAGHRSCFESFRGRKVELATQPRLDPPSEEVLGWLA